MPPGEKDSSKGTRITLNQISAGDRTYALGQWSSDNRSVTARLVVVNTKADITRKQAADGGGAVGTSAPAPYDRAANATVTLQAALVYRMGGPQPVARAKFHLLDKELNQILEEAGLRPDSGQSIVETYGFALAFPEQSKGFYDAAQKAIRAHIVKSTTTDFGGKAVFETVPEGMYYLIGFTETRKGFALWNAKINIHPGINHYILDQENAAVAL